MATRTTRSLVLLLAGLLLCSPLRAQDSEGAALSAGESVESSLDQVRRDQSRLGLRLASLREKMERLAERYRAEGRDRNAVLLSEALAHFDQADLQEKSRQIEQGLAASMLSAVESQDQLLDGLESIYAVLRDRRDVDELRTRSDLLSEGLGELDRLATEQRRLLSQSRAAADSPAKLVDDALGQVDRLDRSLEQADSANELLSQTEGSLGEAALAEWLAVRQAELARAEQPDPARQAALSEALAQLLARLQQPLDAEGAPDLLAAAQARRGRAAEAGADAAAAMQRARQQLERGEVGEAGQGSDAGDADDAGGRSEAGESGEQSRGAGRAAGTAGGESPGSQAGRESVDSGAGSGGESGDESAESAGAQAAGSSPPQPPGDSGPAAPSGSQPEPGQPQDTARKSMDQAARLLEEMRDELLDAERAESAARNRGLAMQAAAQRQAGSQAEQLNQLAQRLEAAEPDQGPELLDRTRELLSQMQALDQAPQDADREAGGEALSAAAQDLAAIRRMLDQRRPQASENRSLPRDEAQREAARAEQQALEIRLRELMDRLSELPDQAYQDPAQRAQDAMGSASEALSKGDDQQAASSQEQAAENLEQAKQELEGERDRYEQLRQEEVLFRLNEELAALLDGQVELTDQTTALAEGRPDPDARLSRSQRRALARLADEQRELSARAASAAESLREDGAVAFVFALEQTADDMQTVAERLAEQEAGRVVGALQEGIQQRLSDLIAVLKEELERRREAMRNQDEQAQDSPPQNAKTPLVPPVAELLLMQRMELMALSRLENFRQELGDEPRLSPRDTQLLERWALEHTRLTDLFESLAPSPRQPPAGDEGEVEIVPKEGGR